MKVLMINSFNEFIEKILDISKQWGKPSGYLWCRGNEDDDLKLLPGVHRLNITLKQETTIITEFLINYKSFVQDKEMDSWELYYMMQHYGMPTRLLDWTKSPFNALFFAFENEGDDAKRVVWVMQPEMLNKKNVGIEAILTPYKSPNIEGLNIAGYLPKKLRSTSKNIPSKPIAIEPILSNRRIVAQQGCFTIHGRENKPINDYVNNKYFFKLKFGPTMTRDSVMSELRVMGIKEEVIYQDLNSLSKRIIAEEVWKY